MREASDDRHAATKIMRESGAKERSVRGEGERRKRARTGKQLQRRRAQEGVQWRHCAKEAAGATSLAKRRRRARQGLRGKAKREREGGGPDPSPKILEAALTHSPCPNYRILIEGRV